MDYFRGSIPIIDDTSYGLAYPTGAAFGAVPRDYDADPVDVRQSPDGLTLIPESEWDARYDEQEATKSSLEHLFLPNGPDGPPAFVNLDQNGHGYCWAYSTGHAVMLDRLVRGYEAVRLNPHSVAAIIKGGRDEGGWCGLSAKWVKENGIAPEGTGPGEWPLHSRSLSHDTAATRAVMKFYRVEEDWYDLGRKEWDQVLNHQQRVTLAFSNIPMPTDRMWWGHSTCDIRYVRIERGSWGWLTLNSWKNWGRHGLAVLRGSKANSDGSVGIRATTPGSRT